MKFQARLAGPVVCTLALWFVACGNNNTTNAGTDDSGGALADSNVTVLSDGAMVVVTHLPDGGTVTMPVPDATVGSNPDGGTGTGTMDGAVLTGNATGAVLTNRNDNARTGVFTGETVLTTSNVTPGHFGLLFTRAITGQAYAQPLYVPGLTIGGRVHNVVYVATEANNVYAFDADDPSATAPLWMRNLGPSVPTVDIGDPAPCPDMAPETGITATPVIDLGQHAIYVSAKSKESGSYFHRLHALDLASGEEKAGSPVVVDAAMPGTGSGAGADGMIRFNPLRQLNRPGMLLVNNTVYMAYGSHCDREPYHGWILGYDIATLQQKTVWATTRNGDLASIWQSGTGITADENGDIYAASGNGTFDGTANPPELGNSFMRLRPMGSTLQVVDWFTPYNQARLDERDFDLGTTAVSPLPGTNYVIAGSKEGMIYVMDRNNMGHYDATRNDAQIAQRFLATDNMDYSHIHGNPVIWNGPSGLMIYLWGEEDYMKVYRFMGTQFATTPAMVSTVHAADGMPGGIMSLSSNHDMPGTAIIWTSLPIMGDANQMSVPGMIRAFDATDVTHELWNSEMAPADAVGLMAKFAPPTVAGGHVFVSTFSNRLDVYGTR